MATSSGYIAVRAEGVSSISEGRIFLLDTRGRWEEGDLQQSILKKGDITRDGKPCEVELAGPGMPIACPDCGAPLESHILSHSYCWMDMTFSCQAHPSRVWLDNFPKTSMGTEWDKTNAWPEYIAPGVPIDRDLLALGGLVINPVSARETYSRERKIAPLKFILTQDGLRRTGLIGVLERSMRVLRAPFASK